MINAVMSREDFAELVRTVKGYEPFAHYIDDYSGHVSADNRNKRLNKEFSAIIKKYVPTETDYSVLSSGCENKGEDTFKALEEWLASTHEYKQWSITLAPDTRAVGTRVSYLFCKGILKEALKFVDDYRPDEGVDERYVETHRSCGGTHQSFKEFFATKKDGNDYYIWCKEHEYIVITEAQFNDYTKKLDEREARINAAFAKRNGGQTA